LKARHWASGWDSLEGKWAPRWEILSARYWERH